jgi:L-ascorbate metabolism protein UlaG (beta-lactamase superfamily)
MDLQFYGANCVVITVGGARLVIDDTLPAMGGKQVAKAGDVLLYTRAHDAPPAEAKLVIDRAGEYEVSDVSVYGIQAKAHIDEDKQRTATMYKLIAKDLRVLVTGHISSKLKESDLESIGTVDVMIVPVGGNGFTLDPTGALELIKEIEPKLVIPTHYADDKLNFEVPAQTLEQALQGLGMEPKERVAKLKLKHSELSTEDTTQLIVLEKN